jgi:rSAM/selenodomain-associated transferase 1
MLIEGEGLMRREDQPSFCGIAIMAKASRAGLTKTRLSPPLSLDDAALCNTAFLKDVAANLLRAGENTSIAGYAAYGPIGAQDFFHTHLPPEIGLLEIWYPDFGVCLMKALAALFVRGHEAACVLNSDSPTLPSCFLAEAASVLAAPGDRIVLGPSTDGGYYILGCKRIHARLFEEIAWSTDAVARQTLERAAELGLAVHMLPAWYDVDDAASLRVARREVLEGVRFHPRIASSPATHTAALFERLLIDDAEPQPVPVSSLSSVHISALTSR